MCDYNFDDMESTSPINAPRHKSACSNSVEIPAIRADMIISKPSTAISSLIKFEKDNGEIHELADSEADSSEDEVDEVVNLHVQTEKGSDFAPAQTEENSYI